MNHYNIHAVTSFIYNYSKYSRERCVFRSRYTFTCKWNTVRRHFVASKKFSKHFSDFIRPKFKFKRYENYTNCTKICIDKYMLMSSCLCYSVLRVVWFVMVILKIIKKIGPLFQGAVNTNVFQNSI